MKNTSNLKKNTIYKTVQHMEKYAKKKRKIEFIKKIHKKERS